VNSIAATYNRLVDKLSSANRSGSTIALFRKSLYIFLLLETVVFFMIGSSIWGAEALVAPLDYSTGWISSMYYLLAQDGVADYYLLFLIARMIAIVAGLLGIFPRMSCFLIYLVSANLYGTAFLTFTAGQQLVLIFLFFLIFIDERKKEESEFKSNNAFVLNNVLTNTFFFAVKLQLVIAYAFAGIYKLMGEAWVNGTALYYPLKTDEYSFPLAQEMADVTWIIALGTYLTLAYQLLFPILVWFKRIKKPFLLVGVFSHLFIAVVLGLWDFGLIMIIAYIIFLPNEDCTKWFDKWSRLTNKFRKKKVEAV
jgi:hypothetical protein